MTIHPLRTVLAGSCLGLGAWCAWHQQARTPRLPPVLAPAAVRSCKPEAPIEVRLGVPRPIGAAALEIDYTLIAGVDCELLEPLVAVGAGWSLASHTPSSSGPVTRGTERSGALVLQRIPAAQDAAGLEFVARFALPDAESAGARSVQQRTYAFGAQPARPIEGLVRVRSGTQFSNDVPALVR